MAAVIKVFRTIRTHWKKSIFFTVALSYGTYYLNDRYRSNLIRRALCEEAAKYGEEIIQTTQKPRKVCVILNPAARKGKAKKLFDKNAAPMLHLAGIDVEILLTTSEGEAKDKVQQLDNIDAIIVAGGDGTLSEVVTGLLRRDDQEKVCRWPIGIIPIGNTNTLARVLYANSESDVRWMGSAALSVIQGWIKPMHVMKIEGEEGKTVYAMNSIQWGQYSDAKERVPKYWYFGPLKHRLTYIIKSLTNWPEVNTAELSYAPPCEGCNKCVEPIIPPEPSFWSWMFGWWRTDNKEEVKDYSNIINEDCGVWKDLKLSTVELIATTTNATTESQDVEEIAIQPGQEEISKTDFIKEGWSRIKDKSVMDTQQRFETKSIKSKEFKMTPSIPEGQETSFYIDNEKFETMPIHVQLLPNKLQFFTAVNKEASVQ
ncbi:acylglycerol kinase, mitochondrial-like [Glandiceps talaboti]